MAEAALKRVNLILEKGKLNRLRRELGARSNSEAVRIAIDRELAAEKALGALGKLRANGTLRDVFQRVRTGQK